jgi:hypothetical protein
VTWLIAVVLLLQRAQSSTWRHREGREPAGGEFSVYNLSAIFAPVLTALASNVLGG